jgi:pimeloyl-ACP methyl ester carboxylesterase
MPKSEIVILVHGLWLHGLAMALMQRRIARYGYRAKSYSYPSVRLSLTENGERLARYCAARSEEKVHFVAHSMGGLVALAAANALPPGRIARIVLLAPPFGDSHSGRRVQRLPGGRSILGRCMGQWLSGPRPGTTDGCEIGVIAGTGRIGLGRLFAPGLPRPNDGVVSVEETRVPGMRDHIVLPVSHTVMLLSAEVAREACAFLANGKFDRRNQSSSK